ncbi:MULTISPECIES: phytoene/squalene synthase family protein [Kocuria]|uniref:Squalene/phytoene synthase family protein n=1 Tax=Kocuria subflava TaxID=1736139 RepID=A0A846TSE3_9MICC|nr:MULTISPECIES: squalene/phytoene synthase family protein [Kocuria]NKE08744.1 squalene/phytoene synthase family protein [Kocuria subflava]
MNSSPSDPVTPPPPGPGPASPSGPVTPSSADRAAALRYHRTAQAAAAAVINRYSTSFGLACRVLGPSVRTHVRSVYALVRVADEIVDGASAGAGVSAHDARELLDGLEAETLEVLERGFSTNLVVHAFGLAADYGGIAADLITPFFASMRADLGVDTHSTESLEDYVYGSAEVVGLMCLRLFLAEHPVSCQQEAALVSGARRLGAAFQKVNFLRDLSEDYNSLGRVYLPGADPRALTEATKHEFLDEIDADLAAARAVIDDLPANGRTAVLIAHDLFAELSVRLRKTPAAQLLTTRIRVPDARKMMLTTKAVASANRGRATGRRLQA